MVGTRIYLNLDPTSLNGVAALTAADGFVVGRGAGAPAGDGSSHDWILWDATPLDSAAWAERDVTWVSSEGLEQTARLRDGWPRLRWVPRCETYRPSVRYDFVAAAPGEGFSVYRPDTSTIQRYRVSDHEEDLQAWLARARGLGFRTLWLDSRGAGERGRGLDLDLLHRARALFGGGRIWLSGGATEPWHLANLALEGGAAAVVLPSALAERYGCANLVAALRQHEQTIGQAGQAPAMPPACRPVGA